MHLRTSTLLLLAIVLISAACNKTTPPGTSSPTSTNNATGDTGGGKQFGQVGVSVLAMISLGELPEIKVAPGKEQVIEIPVKRSEYPHGINMSFETKDAKGITITPEKPVIPDGKDSIKVTVKASEDAASAEIPVTITAVHASHVTSKKVIKVIVSPKE